MRATVVHRSFNVLGGAERVALVTIEALQEMGFKVSLVTVHRPEFNALKKVYDTNIKVDKVSSVLPPHMDFSTWPIHLQALPMLLTLPLCSSIKADLVINTHAETNLPYCTLTLPYFQPNGAPLISYIHDPPNHSLFLTRGYPSKYRQSTLWRLYFTLYRLLFGLAFDYLERYTLTRSLILTNSEFTKRAIKSLYPEVEPIVVRPPVDVETFTRALKSKGREDRILVIARISPEKQLENAIELAKLLPKEIECTIVGTFRPSERTLDYYMRLREMIKHYKLEKKVEIKTNISLSELLKLIARSKVYLHTRPGEPFGIAIVEAVAAGLIPVVPDYGGQAEFIPKKYQYHKMTEAAEIIEKCLSASEGERTEISRISRQFSEEKFKSRIKAIVGSVIS